MLTLLGANTLEKLPMRYTDVHQSCQRRDFSQTAPLPVTPSLIYFLICLKHFQIYVMLKAACKDLPGTEETMCLGAMSAHLWSTIKKRKGDGCFEEVLPSKVIVEEVEQRANLSQIGLKANYTKITIDLNWSS